MRFLGIDPGVSTGIVLYDIHEGILKSITLSYKAAQLEIAYLAKFATYIIIETAPTHGEREQLVRVYDLLDKFPDKKLITMSPGEWKPFAHAQKWDSTLCKTQHEKDAYCLVMYAFNFKVKL